MIATRGDLPDEPYFQAGYVIGFGDGSAKLVASEHLDHLIWDPRNPPNSGE